MKTMKTLTVCAALLAGLGINAWGQTLLFTQYYEGVSNDKFVELTNVSGSSIDFSVTNFVIGLYTNANAENWKSGITSISSSLTINSGILAPGASLLYKNSGAAIPAYATSAATTASFNNFNGNDSVALYSGTASLANLVDALSFTNAGNEGVDKSFFRTSTAAGFDTVAGSDILDFGAVWSMTTLATVGSALTSDEEYLGFSSVTAVPEPSFYAALAGLLGLGVVILRRRKTA